MDITPQEERFLANMKAYGLGDVVRQLADYQDQVVYAVNETGLQGEITLNLKFKRVGKQGMAVIPKVTPKIPRKPMKTVEMFIDQNSHLHEHDPDQMTFDDDVIDINKNKKEVNKA